MATPFVQGHLRNEPLIVEISTSCAHCARPIQIQMDQDLNYTVHSPGAEPLIFEPELNWDKFAEPNIIHAY